MTPWRQWRAAAALALAAASGPRPAGAQQPPIIIALPAPTLTFSSPFLAEDAGFYKKEGLDVSHRILVGVEAVNAVIAGSAQFTIGTGPVFLRAAAHGQRLLVIANLIDKPLVEMVMRKDVAQAMKFDDGRSLAERGRLLKGRTIAIQGVGSIIHAWERLVAARGGLDPETDVRIAPMDPPAMLGALQTKAVDGFATSLPYTTQAVMNGTAVMFASAAQGVAPDLLPFPYGLVMTKPQTCKEHPEECAGVVCAFADSNRMIHDQPEKALGILAKRFAEMDQAVLKTAWKTVAAAHATDFRVDDALLAQADKVNTEAKLLDPKAKLTSYAGLYTAEFLPK
ncbi:MAG: ABC transporter substrate-binding protein [Stellaceae bacterium]